MLLRLFVRTASLRVGGMPCGRLIVISGSLWALAHPGDTLLIFNRLLQVDSFFLLDFPNEFVRQVVTSRRDSALRGLGYVVEGCLASA